MIPHCTDVTERIAVPTQPTSMCNVLEGWLIIFVVDLEKLRRRTGVEGEISKKERRIEANE